MRLNWGLPGIKTMMNPMNLGCHLLNPKKHADKSRHKVRSRHVSSSSEKDQSSATRQVFKPLWGSLWPRPTSTWSRTPPPPPPPPLPYYREVALTFPPNTLKRWTPSGAFFLSLTPGSLCLCPQLQLWVWLMKKAVKSSDLEVLPLCYDFQAANLPEGKYIQPPPSTAKWYKVGQPCYEEKIQEFNTDFAKIWITPKPPGAPMGKVPLPILQELEHQARQNISTLNFTAAFAKTSSFYNATLEKCQNSLKSTFKRVKSQIQKGANPEKAAKRGYEQACEYLDLWNKTVLIQHRALTCLGKSLANILQRELYSMGNTGLLRCEAEMTLLQPHLGETRRQELALLNSSLFKSQLVKEGEDFLLKKGTSKDSQGFGPYQNKPFRGPHNKKRGSYRKRPYGGNSSQNSNQSFSSGRGKLNFRGSRGHFWPHNRGWGRGNPSPQWLLKSLSQSTSRRSPPFFQKRLANKQMFIQRVKHYHQWLRTAIPFKTKSGQIPSDSVRIQGLSKRPSSGHLYPVSSVKERNRKGGKCKISRVLQSPVSSTQASPKVEASHRLKQAQHFSTRRKVQNANSESIRTSLIPGEWVLSIDLSDAYLHIPIHPNSRKYLIRYK